MYDLTDTINKVTRAAIIGSTLWLGGRLWADNETGLWLLWCWMALMSLIQFWAIYREQE